MKVEEEIALPIRGKKSRLTYKDFYFFGLERLGLSESILKEEILIFKNSLNQWRELLKISFLSENMRGRYEKLIEDRWKRLSENRD